jgi:hypothetical protein
MDKVEMLMAIEKTSAILRVYSGLVANISSNNIAFSENVDLKKAAKNLWKESQNLIQPEGDPCSRCKGSGVEP